MSKTKQGNKGLLVIIDHFSKYAEAFALPNFTAEAAAAIFKEMADGEIVRILMFMKPDGAAVILEGLSRKGGAQLKRAALITEELRLAIKAKKT